MPGCQLGGFTVAAVQHKLLHPARPSSVRGVTFVHAAIVPYRLPGRIGQTTYSSVSGAWVDQPIVSGRGEGVCVVRPMRRGAPPQMMATVRDRPAREWGF